MVSIKASLSFYSLLLQLTPQGLLAKLKVSLLQPLVVDAAAHPKRLNELVTWLSDGVARTIVLDKTWDFTGSMGSKTEKGCTPLSNTCTNGCKCNQALAKPTITYDVAGIPPNAIKIGSNKSIVGVGSAGKIKGRGFYIAGAKNIIIQNVESFVDRSRQDLQNWSSIHYMGPGASTVSPLPTLNSVTFKGNYIHNTSGRGPKVGGLHSSVKPNVFLQAANNYWSDIAGNAFQIGEGAKVLAEGNIFEKANTPVIFDIPSNPLWSSSSGVAGCASALGRNCQANSLVSSGSFAGSNTDVLTAAKGMSLAPVADVGTTKANVLKNAGIGKI
ncbi:Pectin lyase 1 [Botrytis cinerea]